MIKAIFNRFDKTERLTLFLITLVVVVMGCLSCGEPNQPPPPPPPITTTIPPTVPVPSDYITIERAGELGEKCVTSTGLLSELCFEEQILSHDGIINPDFALTYCCDFLPDEWPFTVLKTDGLCASPEVELNRVIKVDLEGYMHRLQKVNKRCATSHPQHAPEFCGRTEVRKQFFKEWREEYLEPALVLSNGLNGIKAWCREKVE